MIGWHVPSIDSTLWHGCDIAITCKAPVCGSHRTTKGMKSFDLPRRLEEYHGSRIKLWPVKHTKLNGTAALDFTERRSRNNISNRPHLEAANSLARLRPEPTADAVGQEQAPLLKMVKFEACEQGTSCAQTTINQARQAQTSPKTSSCGEGVASGRPGARTTASPNSIRACPMFDLPRSKPALMSPMARAELLMTRIAAT